MFVNPAGRIENVPNSVLESSGPPMARMRIYTLYERVWHWFQAVCILGLIVTGFHIHYPDGLRLLSFAGAVYVHNTLGWILVLNAFLGFFYYLTTGTIRQLIPEPREFHILAYRQLRYYLYGVFHGEPHPLERSPLRRLNPLQQATYLIILNVLLPLQILTGLGLWFMQFSPWLLTRTGGLSIPAGIHMLGAWTFTGFLLAHVYLGTIGPTPWAHLATMITGYEEVESTALAAGHDGSPDEEGR
ncbi:MAG: cytochrome b/b6 domain-containing protein [Thermogutta sp.]